jgi:2'-5' RNA ligase
MALSAVMMMFAQAASAADPAVPGKVVAINILLEPSKEITARARELNHQLRADYPHGFALDSTHVPHISVLHEFVRTEDLPKVFAAVEQIAKGQALVGKELVATGLEHVPWQGRELTSIQVESTPELLRAQSELIKALARYSVSSAGNDAFVSTAEAPKVDDATIDYVRTFTSKHAGKDFKPHITVGLSSAKLAEQLQAQPQQPMNFTVVRVGVYQLGNVGTARRALWLSSDH